MLLTVPELLAKIRGELRILDAVSAFSECDDKSGIVIDVREPGEVQAKPAEGSVNIPRGVLEMMVLEKVKEASHPIYIHCASGARATLAAEQLHRLGYDDVTVISCSIDAVCEALE
ncbi:MAG: rhodanese-like domain-containing protein [Gammaproteobacteria bacterium]|nr:MAG: rhodanese-like domain-containing protein [Gammaproteobacteria bacterium]